MGNSNLNKINQFLVLENPVHLNFKEKNLFGKSNLGAHVCRCLIVLVLAGDIVSKKKPDPEIYLLALRKAGLKPEECIVIKDSRNGALAASAADMHIVATTNCYTKKEDLSDADVIVTCLGDPDGEKATLKKADRELDFDGVLHVDQLLEYFSKAN